MKVLVTGAAGFIGFHLCRALLKKGFTLVGLDNINSYYDVNLKIARLNELGISKAQSLEWHVQQSSHIHASFSFVRMGVEDTENISQLFTAHQFQLVCHLAAQAGVRYSLENPQAYMESNMVGFLNILEACRMHTIQHLIYASSSSVYGLNKKVPFSTIDRVDHPISLYAASKKSNELMAYTYSHLYGFPTTGLRFFTVYGPWGRPDMAYFSFTEGILAQKPLPVFNKGKLSRDFTYIDDIIEGIMLVVEQGFKPSATNESTAALYNIGLGRPMALMDFIKTLEERLGKKALLEFLPMQAGDVLETWADTTGIERNYGYAPKTDLAKGIGQFIDWYLHYKEQRQ